MVNQLWRVLLRLLFEVNQIVVRDGKGFKDRVTVLPSSAPDRSRERNGTGNAEFGARKVKGPDSVPPTSTIEHPTSNIAGGVHSGFPSYLTAPAWRLRASRTSSIVGKTEVDSAHRLIQFINSAEIVKNFTNFSCRCFTRRLNIRCAVGILLAVVRPRI